MSVIEAVRVYSQKVQSTKDRHIFTILKKHMVAFVGGLLFSLAGFGAGFSPFGIAFACSMENTITVTSTLGAVLGYFLSLESVSALRYTASALAMAVIIISLKSFKNLHKNRVVPVIVTFVCLFVTGFAVALAEGLSSLNILLCFSESIIGGASSYVFFVCRQVTSFKKGFTSVSSKEATALIIAFAVLLLSINDISFYGIYPAHILSCVIILVCGYYGREAGGAIVGVCTGTALTLCDGGTELLAFYSLGGLLCGAFSSFGKIACTTAFAFSGVAVTIICYGTQAIAPVVAETLISVVLFFIITRWFGDTLESVLVPRVASPVIESVKSDIVSKLRRAAEYSLEICSSVTAVNNALNKSDKWDTNEIIKKTKNKVCGSCGLYEACWRETPQATVDNFNALLNLKKSGVHLEYKTAPQGFASACIRTENVCSSFNKLYAEYKVHFLTENRMNEIQSMSAEHFVNISGLLRSLSDSVQQSARFDMETAAQLRVTAGECGFEVADCVCVINDTDKLKIELQVKQGFDKDSLVTLNNRIARITDKRLDLPEQERYEDYVKLIYKEQPDYKIVSSAVQYNAGNEKYSGDSYSIFQDGNGYFYAVICDGMGTGTKAAITSSLAVSLLEKLLKAGFGIKPAISTVNTCLASKSGDECSSSLDLFVVDLYTGHSEFYKCGASETLVKRRGKVLNIGFESMPLGILRESDVGYGTGYLDKGDVVVLCSDGVRPEDYYDIRHDLKSFSGGSVKDFTYELCKKIRKKQPEKNDDMTVLTLVLTDNS